MKTFSQGLLSLLKTNRYNRADLFRITLGNGQVIKTNSGTYDITYNGDIYYSSRFGAWQRGAITSEAAFDLRANDMPLTVFAPADTFFPVGSSIFQTVADSFVRANENPLNPTTWTTAPDPTSGTGFWNPCQIVSNAAESSATFGTGASGANGIGVSFYSAPGFTPSVDQYGEFKLEQITSGTAGVAGIILRSDPSSWFSYELILEDNGGGTLTATIALWNGVNVPNITLFSAIVPNTPGDVYRFSAIGSQLTAYRNGAILGTAVDSTFLRPGVIAIDLEPDTLSSDVRISHFAAGEAFSGLSTVSYMAAAQLGLFDAAKVEVFTARWPIGQMPNPVIASIGVETKYLGFIKPNGSITRSKIEFEVADALYLLNLPTPKHVIQASCRHTLFDIEEFKVYGTRTNCTLDPASFSMNNSVASGSDTQSINLGTNANLAAPAYTQGFITMTTGQNAGLSFSIKQQNGLTNLLLTKAMPLPLAIGDTFVMYQGCDKTIATCQNVFNNLIHFGGQSFVPQPEVGI